MYSPEKNFFERELSKEEEKNFYRNLENICNVFKRVYVSKDYVGSIIEELKKDLQLKEPNMPQETLTKIFETIEANLQKLSGDVILASDLLNAILRTRSVTWYGSIINMILKYFEIIKEKSLLEENYQGQVDQIINYENKDELLKILIIGPYPENVYYLDHFIKRIDEEIKKRK